jgi:hypothetical protein
VPRLTIWLACLSLGLVACSQGTTVDQTTSTKVAATVQSTTTAPSSPAVETTVAPPTADSGRPVAPDFSLELGNGETYTLSEGARPVYLVFWAEW